MQYATAAAVVPTVSAVAPFPALVGAADLASLSAENAQLKKELKALRKSTGGASRTKFYCWVHDMCFHAGTKCTVMLADRTKYTVAHREYLPARWISLTGWP